MQKLTTNSYKGFTLVEMLIVMAIFVILFGMGISAFSGLRNTILVNENSQNIQQDIRWAQRAAILLKREPDEKWLYGIGIDLREITTTGNYTLFKWCSPFNEFADGGALTNSSFPNYNPNQGSGNLGIGNGNLDTDGDDQPEYSPDITKCEQTAFSDTPNGELVAIENRISTAEFTGDPSSIEFPLLTGYYFPSQDQADWPVFVVFESITGKTFFYNSSGHLLNYNSDTSQVASPVDVGIGIVTPQMESGVLITIGHNSGKITNTAIKKDFIIKLIFSNTGGGDDGGIDIIEVPGGDNGGTDGGIDNDSKDAGGTNTGGSDINEEK